MTNNELSFMGIHIGDNEQWIINIGKGLAECQLLKFSHEWWICDIYAKNREAAQRDLYPGPFKTKKDAEAWLSWAIVQLS